jgi:hypothetical protein
MILVGEAIITGVLKRLSLFDCFVSVGCQGLDNILLNVVSLGDILGCCGCDAVCRFLNWNLILTKYF